MNEALKLDPNLTYAMGLMAEAKKKMAPSITTGVLTNPGQGSTPPSAGQSGSSSTTTKPGTTPGTTVR